MGNRLSRRSSYHALLTWLPDHTEWLEEAEFNGLLEGCEGDIYKMVRMAQYVCFKSDLYDHCEDICRYGTLDQLRDMGVYAIRESLADEILNDLSYDEDYAPPIARPTPLWSSTIPRRMPPASRAGSSSLATT